MPTKWVELNMVDKVRVVLRNSKPHVAEHHLGEYSFCTAYQIAIGVESTFPGTASAMGMDIGGKGIGVHYSFAQYIARELSNGIGSKKIKDIEGGFLSSEYVVQNLVYDNSGVIPTPVEASNENSYDLSIFRMKKCKNAE